MDEETAVTRSVEIPEAVVEVVAGHFYTMQSKIAWSQGDGGLREALEKLAKERDAVGGHTASDYAIRPYELFDLLKAHPAAPAVPQPVDREALAKLIEGADHYDTCSSMLNPDAGYECSCLLADLRALLAGEQEQVESPE